MLDPMLSRGDLGIDQLRTLCAEGKLFALVDSHFGPWKSSQKKFLEPKDTDPEFFEIIAWSEVTYQPPVLIKLERDDLNTILNQLSTDRWGIFIASSFSLEELAEHFQKFVITKGPDGDPYFFKFQDAAVLEVFLNTWSKKELDTFFGPCDAFGVTDLDSLEIVKFEYEPKDLTRREKTLPAPEDCLISLRQSQLDQCFSRIEIDLVKIIAWHLRNEHSYLVQHISKEILEQRVLYGIRKGRKYRLDTVADLAGFVGLLFEIAPNFDQHPSIQSLLTNFEIPPEKKLDILVDQISEEEWEEASHLYDDKFWPRQFKKSGS